MNYLFDKLLLITEEYNKISELAKFTVSKL